MQREQLKVVAEKAVLVQVRLPGRHVDPDDPLQELRSLAETAGAVVVGELVQKRQKPRGSTYLGKGKIEELSALVAMTDGSLVIFDNDLLPRQIRALEEELECKIIDRSELILDIFANRATTHAAKLQVEIAQLEYTYPRLRAMWDHLGQIVGGAPVGIGTRGPGEQQLEIDRRLARQRLGQLKRELRGIEERKRREVSQRNLDHFTVGLVGYTNAGKSTLFNKVTAGGAFAHGKLFATLAPRVEKWDLGGGEVVMLSDTVGFIRELPHHLVASFRCTLEETVHAQLLLLVVDAADPDAEDQLATVVETLDEIGATTQPRILVLNKTDLVADRGDLLVWLNHHPDAVPVSAVGGGGLEELAQTIRTLVVGPVRAVRLEVPLREGRALGFLEQRVVVGDRQYTDRSVTLDVRIGRRQVERLLAMGTKFTIDGRPPHDALADWPEPDPDPVVSPDAAEA